MIRFSALGVRFSLPLLALLMPLLAAKLGLKGSLAAVGISLGLHELGHLLAAKLARVEIVEIRILPFGGSARMENPYVLSPAQLIAVAAAGPAANLALMLVSATLAHWQILDSRHAAALVRSSLWLMLFNLLPALPLDGGRMLYALLQGRIGREHAARLGIVLGRILAALLLLGTLLLRIRSGRWNLSFILAAIFLLASGQDERSALLRSRAEVLERALEATPGPRPARIYQLDGQTPASEAMRLLRPRESAWFVMTEGGVPCGILDSGRLVKEVIHGDAGIPLSRIPGTIQYPKQREG
ncbi:MAG: site-2 protease family protein [Clostridia bacterium]|nr:site-2 protease family protein [Clostridia bacterium]